jgi:propanol-preferring alcohol dehydrogenase
VIQIAQSRGNVVYVVTRGEKHRQLAREMGAAWVGETAAELPDVVDSAILFAPAGELVPAALERLDWGGTLAVAGIHLSDIPVLNYERHLFHERNLHSVTANTRDDGRRLLAEAAEIPLRPHVTHYRLEQANQALLDLKADRIQGTGVLLVGD